MPVPSNPQDLINIIREKLFNNTSGLIEEPDLREVLENIVKVLDAKFSMFSPNLTEEQYAQWNLILDYMLRETKGVLSPTSPAPTEKGKYLLSSAGTYTNLGGLVATADKLNYAYFDGTTWSLIAVDVLKFKNSEPTSDVILAPNITLNTGFYISKVGGYEEANPDLSTTNHIPIPQDKRWLKLSYIADYAPYHQFAFYDKDKVFIPNTASENQLRYFKVPDTAVYVRFSLENVVKDRYIFQFCSDSPDFNDNKILERIREFPKIIVSNESAYINQLNGVEEPAAQWYSSSDYIFIPRSFTHYSLPSGVYHQFAFYDINKKFISTQDSINGYTTGKIPKDAFYMRLTLEAATYNKYWVKFSNGNTIATTVNVGKGGFKTIKSAVDSVGGGINEPIIVNLSEGIYDEELKFHNRKITIIGANRNKTIIRGTTGDYYKPAMEVSGEVYFENLTFEETSENISTPAPAMRAYAVHLDYAGAGIMEFNNCIFKGNAHNTVGIGLHNNQSLRFVNCEFHHTSLIGASCMFAHNNPFPENGVNQKMEIINCQFYVYGRTNIMVLNDAAWTWQDGHRVDNGTTFKFINNTFYSDLGVPTISLQPASFGAGKITGNVKLHPASCGNNIDILNYNV